MRLFKRRSRFIDKFLKPQKKITKKLLKEYDKNNRVVRNEM